MANKYALAQLAGELESCIEGMLFGSEHSDEEYLAVCKAKNIVLELAKVELYQNIYGDWFAPSEEARDALVRCHAIAEEGAKR